ncbi:MAG: phosphate signaling complex protein PhoU [Chloroflexi bacterium]|nr:phosphate signaling complex protein PhoU [Chloroflexota bacterium]MDA1219787.1 phosphate signaling complex protein PhoU [Chloroflexota bacterium]PKB57280.1 MAG: phosphate transport system regulatory protein PhoU [SAR202 cluster bacterium Casp-Chloro-G3]
MVRADFDRNLKTLQDDLISLGSMVEKAVTKSLIGLKNRDLQLSRQVVEEDDYIDQQRYQLEEQCIDLIATQQPIAIDLRTLMAVLHIATELERMGDYAEGIAKISIMMGDEPPLKPLIDIPRMAEKATTMLQHSLDALVNRDEAAALEVRNADDEVDDLYEQIYRELLTYMIDDPSTIQRATYLLWVAHDLERIADRATNIAERVIFLVTGRLTGVNVSQY